MDPTLLREPPAGPHIVLRWDRSDSYYDPTSPVRVADDVAQSTTAYLSTADGAWVQVTHGELTDQSGNPLFWTEGIWPTWDLDPDGHPASDLVISFSPGAEFKACGAVADEVLAQILGDARAYRLGEANGYDDPDLDPDDLEALQAQDAWRERLSTLIPRFHAWAEHRDLLSAMEDDGHPPSPGAWEGSDEEGCELAHVLADLVMTVPPSGRPALAYIDDEHGWEQVVDHARALRLVDAGLVQPSGPRDDQVFTITSAGYAFGDGGTPTIERLLDEISDERNPTP